MNFRNQGLRFLGAACLLAAVSCSEDASTTVPPKGNHKTEGSFQVTLVQTGAGVGYTSVLGRIYNGPNPSSIAWKQVAAAGSCKLFTPKAPFCDPGCGSGAACVEDGKCQDFAKAIGAGRVSVKGIKARSGATEFVMDPVLNSYQPPSGTILELPPFVEGAAVTFSATGDTGISAFSVTANGISPMSMLHDSLVLAAGKPIILEWTPAKVTSASMVSVLVDVSHHGGSKGKIECEGPDNGTLEIAATLVDQLKALGVSGFPKVETTRKATATNTDVKVDLVLESQVVTPLSIPGLVSCFDDEGCPGGQKCQSDLQCK
jgi:hypothetical protein